MGVSTNFKQALKYPRQLYPKAAGLGSKLTTDVIKIKKNFAQ